MMASELRINWLMPINNPIRKVPYSPWRRCPTYFKKSSMTLFQRIADLRNRFIREMPKNDVDKILWLLSDIIK